MTKVKATEIAQFNMLQMLPSAFVWIEIRGIARQALKMHLLCSTVGKEVFDVIATVNW